MGRLYRNPLNDSLAPVWTYWDGFTAEGAELSNGDLEAVDAQGRAVGWTPGGGLLISDPKVAASGRRCLKTWHDGRFVRLLQVRKGQPVTIRMKVRGEVLSR
jgi:hypothetical protein